MTYAGGNASSTTGINWSSTKGTLGYIPVAISMDDKKGTVETSNQQGDEYEYQERRGMVQTTTTTIKQLAMKK